MQDCIELICVGEMRQLGVNVIYVMQYEVRGGYMRKFCEIRGKVI